MLINPSGAEPNLTESAYRRLRRDIVTCVIEPGRRVSERGLATEYDLGLAAVRAALARLEQDGLVTAAARRGYTVTSLTVKAVDDLFEFWRVLAPEIVRLAVARATPSQREAIASALMVAVGDDSARTAAGQDARGGVDEVIEFFIMLAERTANAYVISAFRHISGDLSRVRRLLLEGGLEEPGRSEVLASLISSGDSIAAAQAFQDYADVLRGHVNEALRRSPSVLASRL